ncbi:MAG: DsbA family protein [Clostridiales bacterium]|nr:DsbA family protein [Clostridiales bacterium]
MKNIIITNFTDPICVWCWATEPVFRALETHFPNQIEFRYISGGLVRDIDDFSDPLNDIKGGSDAANEEIISHWLESADRHGMPIKPDGFHLFSKEYPSTYPQNIAYKAAQMVAPDKADSYLRRIREATFTEAKVTSRLDVQVDLAKELGIDTDKFLEAINSGQATKKFNADLAITASTGVDVFPTFLVKTAQARQVLVRSFNTFEDFVEIISYLTDGALKPIELVASYEALADLMTKHPRLALEEVRQAFDFSTRDEADKWLNQFVDEGRLIKEEAGTSYFVRLSSDTVKD